MTQAATQDKYLNILFPTGRLVSSNLYEPRTKDMQGNPLVYKSGKNAGQPKVDYSIGVAIPKTQAAWYSEPWGQQIHQFAHQVWGNMIQRPDFAWKVIDGDSAIPNQNNKLPKDQEGYPGHWVIFFGRNSAPRIVNSDGSAYLLDANAVKAGYYVQVQASLKSNENAQKPGLYYNHDFVSLQAYGQEISRGPDPSQIGFGKSALPAGASAVPIGGMSAPMPTPGGMAPPPAMPGMAAPLPTGAPVGVPAPQAMQGVPMPAPVAAPHMPAPGIPAPQQAPIMPNPGFVQNAMQPPALTPPALPVAPQMGPNAQGFTYEQWKSQGHTDEALRASGVII